MIFDMDGVLVATEKLKALSYARAASKMSPSTVEEEVIESYKEVVGTEREEMAKALFRKFDLEEAAKPRMAEFGVSAPWQAFLQMRLRIYEAIVSDPEVLRQSRIPYNISLLDEARRYGCSMALVTMSRKDAVQRVLEAIDLKDAFEVVVTREDVKKGKPDPEIYKLAIKNLGAHPAECLVIEDSAAGVNAALASGAWCIAVPTPFTRDILHAEHLIEYRWIVDDPNNLVQVVRRMFEERRQELT